MKTTTSNWAVLRECGQEPMQFYWFRSVIRFFNGMIMNDNPLVKNVLRADIQLSERYDRCWTAHVRAAFVGLPNCSLYEHAVRDFAPIQLKDFIPDLRYRQQNVWRVAESANPREADWKLPVYHHWFALPLGSNNISCKCPAVLPHFLTLDLPRHVSRHVSCFRLRSHRLKVESVHWQDQDVHCDCGCHEVQDEKHVLFYCRHPAVCSLRDKYFDLFEGRALGFTFRSSSAGRNLYLDSNCVIQDWLMNEFMHQHNFRFYRFLSELYRVFL